MLLALCDWNPPVPVARTFGVFFDMCLNKRLSKQSRRRWFDTPTRSLWRHCDEKFEWREHVISLTDNNLVSRDALMGQGMMTSLNGNIFRVTGPLCGEFTFHRWIPHTKASDAELWCFLWFAPWINGWVNNREAGDLIRHRAHYDVIVIGQKLLLTSAKCIDVYSHVWKPNSFLCLKI